MHVKLPRCLRYVDRSSMAFGNEARLPLLDSSIVELGFYSSNSAKIDEINFRKFMKFGAKKFFPKNSDLLSNKRSVADPQKVWLKKDLKDFVLGLIKSKKFRERGIFNYKECLNNYETFLKSDILTNSFGIFQILVVESWFKNLIDN